MSKHSENAIESKREKRINNQKNNAKKLTSRIKNSDLAQNVKKSRNERKEKKYYFLKRFYSSIYYFYLFNSFP